MKHFIFVAILSLAFAGCGKDKLETQSLQTVTQTVSASTGFEGYYMLPDAGYAEIVQDNGKLQDIVSLKLMVRNSDGTSGYIPLANVSNLPITNNKLLYSFSAAYTAAANNVRADAGNAAGLATNTPLAASYTTLLTFYFEGGQLKIRVQISNAVGLMFDHVVTQE